MISPTIEQLNWAEGIMVLIKWQTIHLVKYRQTQTKLFFD